MRPGLTNRILGRFVRRVFVTFEETKRWFSEKKVRVVGNPVRPELLVPSDEMETEPRTAESPIRILVVGKPRAVALNKRLPRLLQRIVDGKESP